MNKLRRRWRLGNRLWAWLAGYYWLPCVICGQMYGGHEAGVRWREPRPGEDVMYDNPVVVCCWKCDD